MCECYRGGIVVIDVIWHWLCVNMTWGRVKNVVLDGWPPPISNSEKELTRKERSTLAHLRSGYCRLPGSYKSRIKKDANLDVCAECGTTHHDVKHLFVCPAHQPTLIPSDIWSRPTDAVRELSYLEARDPLWNELKGEQQQHRGGGHLVEPLCYGVVYCV